MDAQTIKEHIFSNEKVEFVLENLGMHHIQWHNGRTYITCGMPDGDNPSSTVIYCDTSFLQVTAYTRDIVDPYGISDIISLVSFVKKTIFTQSISWLCDILGLDYYSHNDEVVDFALDYMTFADKMVTDKDATEIQLKPIKEEYLKAYLDWNNTIFRDDNISCETQTEFEIGYAVIDDRITIPIRDEMGRLVGVKGRLAWTEATPYNPKYIYMHQCAKSRICYGLYKTLPHIQESNEIIICESEKGVMQLWTYGYRNAVAVGGHSISLQQEDLIIQSGAATIVIAFDKDVEESVVRKEIERLSLYRRVEYIIDFDNILNEKESPMDNPDKWIKLYSNRKLYIK